MNDLSKTPKYLPRVHLGYFQLVLLPLLMLWMLPFTFSQSAYQFNSYTKEDRLGLYNNSIGHIIQDQFGFIWLGTGNGLHRFDGQEFVQFRYDPQNPNSISANSITDLYIDREQNLWIGTEGGLNRLNTITGQLDRIDLKPHKKDKAPLHVKCIIEDQQHNLLVGTLREGLFVMKAEKDKETFKVEQFTHQPKDSSSIAMSKINYLLEDASNQIWIISDYLIDRLNIQTGLVHHFNHTFLENQEDNGVVMDATISPWGNILLNFQNRGVFYIDPSKTTPEISPYLKTSLQTPDLTKVFFSTMLIDQDHQLWLGTVSHGIFLIDSSRTSYRILKHQPEELGSLSSSNIHSIYQGKEGNVWVGTSNAGLNRSKRISNQYHLFRQEPDNPNTLSEGRVMAITEDSEQNLWFGHLGSGIDQFRFDPQQGLIKLQSLQHDASKENTLLSNNIIQILTDRNGFLWIATNGSGLNKLDPRSGKIEAFLNDPADSTSISGNRIWGICEDKNGYIWIGVFRAGLNRIDPQTKTVKRFIHDPDNPNSLSHNEVLILLADSKGDVWAGTSAGLNQLDPVSEKFTRYFHDPDDPNSLSSNFILVLHEDSNQDLWVGTRTGLNRLRPSSLQSGSQTYKIKSFYESDGLPSNAIRNIQSDNFGNLWVGTDNGLARLISTQPKNAFTIINIEDGQENTSYFLRANFNHKKSGWLFFGRRKEILAIHPNLLKQNYSGSQLLLSAATKFRLDGSEQESVTDYFVGGKKTLSLNHYDQVLTLNLSELNWIEGRTYEYQLNGFNEQWIKTEGGMELTFTNLVPGEYTLRARGLDFDNQPLEEIHLLNINVFPPWWKSGWAYLAYLLLLVGGIYGFIRWRVQQLKRRTLELEALVSERTRIIEAQKDRLQELNHVKSRFFTNISHELRTPLTIIGGMTEQIEKAPQKWLKKGLQLIKRNNTSLLNLVNQILDLRKLETGTLQLNLIQGDIIFYLSYILESFHSLAENKSIKLHFLSNEKELMMDYDKEKLLRVISNLLSNAIKFTQEGGDVYLTVGKQQVKSDGYQIPGTSDQRPVSSIEQLIITVRDSGIGIPEAKLPFIFDRFYQVDDSSTRKGEGTGIGLALTMELVKLMEGEIEAESEVGKGTNFKVIVPISRKAEVETNVQYSMSNVQAANNLSPLLEISNEQQLTINAPSSQSTLLIIEDNPDVVQYLQSLLQNQYQLEIAIDGQEGIDKAIEFIPDLILSDVMMPKKDGFEVCDTLKTDERTSHIPIVLLTAKADVDSRLKGLKRGADAYLAKPFNQEELFIRLEKLHQLRLQLQARFSSLESQKIKIPSTDEKTIDSSAAEVVFVEKLRKAIEANLDKENFGIPELCKVANMSRAQLHRKIKSLTNRSTSHFIRSIRLHKAKTLLQKGDFNITQVAYEVGIKDPAYFSRIFSEEFKVSPRAFVKN